MDYSRFLGSNALAQHPHDDHVWIGGVDALDNLPDGVDAVVSLCRLGSAQVPAPGVDPRDHVEVWLLDESEPAKNPNLDFVLTDAVAAVEALRAEGKTVLLHCVQAQSRTPAVAALYGARLTGRTPTDALGRHPRGPAQGQSQQRFSGSVEEARVNASSVGAEPSHEPAPLEVRIHRGAHEIGGNCVELRHGQDTLILDIGKPLTAAWDDVVPLPAAIGFDDNGTRPLGVIISHGHQDHWGLAPQLPTDIPVFIGEGAANILRAAQFWGSGVDLHEAGHLHDRVPFTLGPFTITPYLADHSAYDAFSLLVEAGGRSLFYTGDIRGHGRKASAFERLLADPPSPVHAILMEGTSFRTPDPTRIADPGRPNTSDRAFRADLRPQTAIRGVGHDTDRVRGRGPARRHAEGNQRAGRGAGLGTEHRPARHRLPGRAARRPRPGR